MKEFHVTCRFSVQDLNGKDVQFEIPLSDGGTEFGIGILRAKNAPKEEMKIIRIDSPSPPALCYPLDQACADRLEVDSTGEADYSCILPAGAAFSSSEDRPDL